MKKFPNQMHRYRAQYHLSQADCAKRAGIDRTQWAHYESGKNVPNVYTAIKISRVFCKSVEEVFHSYWKGE